MYPDNLLSRSERVLLARHPHWKVLTGPVVFFIAIIGGGFASAAVVRNWQQHTRAWLAIAVVALLALLLFTVLPVIRWRTEHFVLTNYHIFYRTGVLRRHGHQIPLVRIRNIQTSVSFWGRLLGYGSLVVDSAVDEPLEFDDIASLTKVQAVLNQLMMNDRG